MPAQPVTFTERETTGSLIERTVGDAVILRPRNLPYSVADYFLFVLQRFTECLQGRSGVFYIHGGGQTEVHSLAGTVRNVYVQLEHTLVLPGGRDHFDAPLGNILWNDQRYLVRLYRDFWERSDVIVEYSVPNILNLESLEELKARYRHKVIYVPPLVFPREHITPQQVAPQPRSNAVVTTFIDVNQPRRAQLIHRLEDESIPARNVTGVYGQSLQNLLRDTKIVLNIHQTDHHHTLEELRILPCLLSKTIVIAEDSPLKEFVPYHQYVVWSSYDGMVETIRNVLHNYDAIYDKFYGAASGLPKILNAMDKLATEQIVSILAK